MTARQPVDPFAVLGGGRAVVRKGKGVNLLGADEVGKRGSQSPEARAAASERMKKLHADPAFAKANAERMKKLNADPEFAKANAARSAERLKKRHSDPEFAKARDERARENMKKMRADPQVAAKLRAAWDRRRAKTLRRRIAEMQAELAKIEAGE